DRAVNRMTFCVALQRLAVDFAVHRAPDEVDAWRNPDVEMNDRVVVASIRAALATGLAIVRFAASDRWVHGTNCDPSGVRHDLDSNIGGVAAASGAGRGDLNLAGA